MSGSKLREFFRSYWKGEWAKDKKNAWLLRILLFIGIGMMLVGARLLGFNLF